LLKLPDMNFLHWFGLHVPILVLPAPQFSFIGALLSSLG
jgi:hypothetical protein